MSMNREEVGKVFGLVAGVAGQLQGMLECGDQALRYQCWDAAVEDVRDALSRMEELNDGVDWLNERVHWG
jgi:hypothetical protein